VRIPIRITLSPHQHNGTLGKGNINITCIHQQRSVLKRTQTHAHAHTRTHAHIPTTTTTMLEKQQPKYPPINSFWFWNTLSKTAYNAHGKCAHNTTNTNARSLTLSHSHSHLHTLLSTTHTHTHSTVSLTLNSLTHAHTQSLSLSVSLNPSTTKPLSTNLKMAHASPAKLRRTAVCVRY
jgi:hypothetical protein